MNINSEKSEIVFKRTCVNCKKPKLFEDFYWDKTKCTLRSTCKKCLSELSKIKYRTKKRCTRNLVTC